MNSGVTGQLEVKISMPEPALRKCWQIIAVSTAPVTSNTPDAPEARIFLLMSA